MIFLLLNFSELFNKENNLEYHSLRHVLSSIFLSKDLAFKNTHNISALAIKT